jgi:5-methylcytosine-specific restriction endonuclease McrA
MAWSSSDRRSRLPKDWSKRRLKVKDRAKGRCQAEVHEPRCDGIGTECDHIVNNDDHSLANLQWLSSPCHIAKTQREAKAAAFKVGRRRPRNEQHPGVIT